MLSQVLMWALLLLATACGGAEFSAADASAGGDTSDWSMAGSSASLSAGSAGAAHGGVSSTAGSGGQPETSGSSAGAASAAGAPDAGAPAKCEFDPDMITKALPGTFSWEEFVYTNGEACVKCDRDPCQTFAFVWGVPQLNEDGSYTYLPNTGEPMVNLAVGANDGACAKQSVCGVKSDNPSLSVYVEQQGGSWVITDAKFGMAFFDNACSRAIASVSPTGAMFTAIGAEFSEVLKGRKLGCVKP